MWSQLCFTINVRADIPQTQKNIPFRVTFCQSLKGKICPKVEMVLCHFILQTLTGRYDAVGSCLFPHADYSEPN